VRRTAENELTSPNSTSHFNSCQQGQTNQMKSPAAECGPKQGWNGEASFVRRKLRAAIPAWGHAGGCASWRWPLEWVELVFGLAHRLWPLPYKNNVPPPGHLLHPAVAPRVLQRMSKRRAPPSPTFPRNPCRFPSPLALLPPVAVLICAFYRPPQLFISSIQKAKSIPIPTGPVIR
jgi:hypothetical protein